MFLCVAAISNDGRVFREHYAEDTPEGWAEIDGFVREWNKPGFGVYNCVSPLKDKRRSKNTVAQITQLHWDIDLKKVTETKEQIIEKLRGLHEFGILSQINDSGRGLHFYSLLNEPIDATEQATEVERAEQLLKRMAVYCVADPMPTHFAALMRRPGTLNSKEGGGPCKTIIDIGTRCELSDIETMLDLVEEKGSTLLTPRESEEPRATSGNDASGSSGPIDVEAQLAAMQFGGNPGIHWTQLTTTAALVNAGKTVEEAVDIVLTGTRAAVANNPDCVKWNWEKEETDIRKMCFDFVSKAMRKNGEDLGSALPSELQGDWEAALAAGKCPCVARRGSSFHVRAYSWGHDTTDAASGHNDGATEDAKPSYNGGATAEGNTSPKERPYRFKLVPFSDMRPGVEQLYLVDELIPVAGLVDIWGGPKTLKSFWTLDMMFHVTMGWEYRDRSVRQGAVVYSAFEGAHGYKKRIEALRRHYQIESDAFVPLYIMPGQANLIKEHAYLIADIKGQLGETKPAAVVLDTLNKSLIGSESKDIDMGAYVRASEAIRDAFGCVVIIVHHCGLDESRPRGHTSLPGAVDAQLAVVREGNHVTVTVEMMRDGPEDTVVTSAVETIEVGEDMNGKTLTSLVVVPTEMPVGTSKRKWTRTVSCFQEALNEALLNSDHLTVTINGTQIRAADREQVRMEFYARYPAKGDTPQQQQDNRKHQFSRCVARAQADKLIGVRVTPQGQTLIWLAAADPSQTYAQ
jgi:AAA domain